MNPIIMTVVLIVSFGGFFYFLNRKIQLILKLKPEMRWDVFGMRVMKVLTFGLFQNKMITGDPKAGFMHAVIFYGFMTLLFRKIQLIVIGYSEDFVYPGLIGGAYAWLKDFIEVAVVLAILYAFFRRLVVKPRRLEPNKEAMVILGLILGIMVTDFMYDGFKFALKATESGELASLAVPDLVHERHFAFVGSAVGTALSGLSLVVLKVGYHLFYWLQLALVFGFLVYLPIGEHFHILTAFPALLFSHNSPLNKVPKVDLEALMEAMEDEDADEDMEPEVGIQNASQLLWKDGLDVFTCTECGRCKDSCPTFLTDKPLSLKWVNDSLKHHLMDVRETLLAEKTDELPDLVGETISEDTLWACTTCGYCEAACPLELEHLGKIYKMRQYKVMMDTEFPDELQDAFANYESQSNPWGLNSATRGDWAKDLDVAQVESEEQVADLDYLFYVGSAQSFDNRNQKVAKAFVKILKEAGIQFAILGGEEGSTGECVRRAGNEMLFQELAVTLVETLNEYGVKKIVTCDPHAYNSLKNEYPEFDGNYEVIHHTELIERLLREGKISVSAEFEKVIYHEPCYLGRHNKVYDAPRSVIDQVTRDEPLEFKLNRHNAMCCGAGGGRMWMEETIGSRINVERVKQAVEGPVKPSVIATACPYCTVMMTDGVTDQGLEEEIQTLDIAELVAKSLVTEV
ncbi:MAG: Fe-S oxidoreductase FadF [Acidobacteria bacterium]|nr:MAG: Fe-S oxidoreductase FadF [Acidobacteriota bacterium]